MSIIVWAYQLGDMYQQIYVLNNGTLSLVAECLLEGVIDELLMACNKFNTNEVCLRGSAQMLLPYVEELADHNIKVQVIK